MPRPDGTIGDVRVDTLSPPASFTLPGGTSWSPCVENPGDGPHVEGMTIDAKRRLLFAAQEDVVIWKVGVSSRGFTTASAHREGPRVLCAVDARARGRRPHRARVHDHR